MMPHAYRIPPAYRAAELINTGREFTGGDLMRVTGMTKHKVGALMRKLADQGVIRSVGIVHGTPIWQKAHHDDFH
jgi:transcription initiation factor IIE alpha subunit